MLMYELFVRSNVDTIDLVVSDIAVNPLNLRSDLIQHIAGSHGEIF